MSEKIHELHNCASTPNYNSQFKDVRVQAPITCIKLGIPIYFIDQTEFITVQCKKIFSRANNEIECFEFSSIKRALRPHLRTIIAIQILIYRFASPYGKT